MKYKGYTARVEFDSGASVFHGEVEGVRDVITFEGTSVEELKKSFQDSVDDYLAMCEGRNEEPDKPYSGKFVVRVDPELHRELAVAASEIGKSLNALSIEAMSEWLLSAKKALPAKERITNAYSAPLGSHAVVHSGFPIVTESQIAEKVWTKPSGKTPDSQKPYTYKTPSSITPGNRAAA